MYRAVALAFIRSDVAPTAEMAERVLPSVRINFKRVGDRLRVVLNDEDVTDVIRRPDVTELSSRVAALAPVREKMVEEQRRIANLYEREGGGVVLDGRDIGTVVFPDADVKVFITATDRVRARRRYEELARSNEDVTYDDVLEDVRSRDERDVKREVAPLRKANDAIEIDTSGLNVEEQVAVVIRAVMERDKPSAV